MRTLTKTIEKIDYEILSPQISVLKNVAADFEKTGCFIDGLTEMRLWEYGLATKALMDWLLKQPLKLLPDMRIVDIGAGDGLLGPALALTNKFNITEIEPRSSCIGNRRKINQHLGVKGKSEIKWAHTRMPNQTWHVVFCTSVVEHVPEQDAFWNTLMNAVEPGGLLFMTTDVVPDPNLKYQFDNLRAVNYTTQDIKARTSTLLQRGFKFFGGEPDWEYHGNMAYDYSFMSMCLTKERV